jgi:hypothetical protein
MPQTIASYLASVKTRFEELSFSVEENGAHQNETFSLFANSGIRFHFAGTAEDCFAFRQIVSPAVEDLSKVCADAWEYALDRRGPIPWYGRVHAFFARKGAKAWGVKQTPHEQAGVNLCVFGVTVAETASDDVIEWIQSTVPPFELGKGIRVPVLFVESTGQLHSFQKVPWFGNALYKRFKKVIARSLRIEESR